jgi:hypothetical protein
VDSSCTSPVGVTRSCTLGLCTTLDPPPPEMQQLMTAVAGNQTAMDAFVMRA